MHHSIQYLSNMAIKWNMIWTKHDNNADYGLDPMWPYETQYGMHMTMFMAITRIVIKFHGTQTHMVNIMNPCCGGMGCIWTHVYGSNSNSHNSSYNWKFFRIWHIVRGTMFHKLSMRIMRCGVCKSFFH